MGDNGDCCRILVAEDDLLFAATVYDFLTGEGFCIAVAEDGQAALEFASQTKIAALVTDLKMPRLDGIALVRSLRATHPALPVVVMTGYAPIDWQTTLQRDGEGPLILLDKPIKLATLLSTLRRTLNPTQPDQSRG
jgi:CheY-like chemotaxis protein